MKKNPIDSAVAGVTKSCVRCGRPFIASGRRRHCGDACCQAAYRDRQVAALPAIESVSAANSMGPLDG